MIRKVLQPIFTAWSVVTFVVGFLVLFPVFLLLGLLPYPYSSRLMVRLTGAWARNWLFTVGMPIHKSGIKPSGKRYVIVANHISYLDTVNIFAAIPLYFLPLGKIEMSQIPLFGLLYRKLSIMVNRDEPASRSGSFRQMHRVLQQQGSVLIFPEGTFNETGAPLKHFYDGAFRLAITAQAPLLPIVFPDTVHRWHFSKWYNLWPGKNRVVFLEPISTAGLTPDDVHLLKEKVAQVIQNKLLEIRTNR